MRYILAVILAGALPGVVKAVHIIDVVYDEGRDGPTIIQFATPEVLNIGGEKILGEAGALLIRTLGFSAFPLSYNSTGHTLSWRDGAFDEVLVTNYIIDLGDFFRDPEQPGMFTESRESAERRILATTLVRASRTDPEIPTFGFVKLYTNPRIVPEPTAYMLFVSILFGLGLVRGRFYQTA